MFRGFSGFRTHNIYPEKFIELPENTKSLKIKPLCIRMQQCSAILLPI